ncbi:uncharacterized protein LOC115986314 isoform X3 [Quercus lobata]|uniref:uncharacterized protein LOC115986314 isoform X3 n=1 Tax=Quercus lobata TaxID=97700 RepID=UPI0012440D65|nr:uncharacterized protein LOC115986314 isoform X3 [Quercus lobata]
MITKENRKTFLHFGWSKWTLACISTMTFSDLMLKRMIARAARGILIVFQVKRMINPLQIMSLVKYRHYKSPQLEWLFLG